MSLYTSIGTGLWRWDPFRRLERHQDDTVGRVSKLLWLALYTTPEAKAALPGMFVGSVTTMAESASIPVDVTRTCLDRLLEDDLVEYDVERRVLRMTVLPDSGESPSNGRAIRGWWRRFQNIPECQIRDNHVSVLRWIIDDWCRVAGKPMSNDHAAAWNDTFGRLPTPAPRRRVPKHIQTDLFTASSGSGLRKQDFNMLDTNKCSTSVELDPRSGDGSGSGSQSPEEGGSGGGRPRLALVPRVSCLDADDLAEVLSDATSGKFPLGLRKAQRQALGRAIDACAEQISSAECLAVLRDYVKQGMPQFEDWSKLSLEDRAMRSRGITPELVASPGWLSLALERSRQWAELLAARRAMLETEPLPP